MSSLCKTYTTVPVTVQFLAQYSVKVLIWSLCRSTLVTVRFGLNFGLQFSNVKNFMSNSGIGLSAHLSSPLIFTFYIRTSILSFLYTTLEFLHLIVNMISEPSTLIAVAAITIGRYSRHSWHAASSHSDTISSPSLSTIITIIEPSHHQNRVSWVYLLCNRSKVVTIVTHFNTEVVTQYSTTSKILRTDNTLEFVQTSLPTFCVDRDIINQTTYPYTSQQTGVAEQKHRQLLDITRTLLIEMHVPSYLWSDPLITKTYFKNWLPSAPLGGAIPLHRLLPTSSLFSLLPRVFGCIAFV